MRVHRAVAFVAVAFVIGSGLAAVPGYSNIPCYDHYQDQDRVRNPEILDERWALWPPGLIECKVRLDARRVVVDDIGASVGDVLAWSVGAALLLGVVLRRRRSAAARGALVGACVLSVFGWTLSAGGALGAAWATLLLGGLAAYALEVRLRRPAQLAADGVLVVLFVPFLVLAVWFVAFGTGFSALAVVVPVATTALLEAGSSGFIRWLNPPRQVGRSAPP